MRRDCRCPLVHKHLPREVGERVDPLVRQWAPEDLREDAAHGPNVDLLRDLGLAVEELRRHVARRASVVLLRDVCPVHGLCEAEIAQLDVQAQVQDHVQALQVAVHDHRRLRVQVHHPVGQLQAHVRAVQRREPQLADVQEVVEGAAGHVLRDEAQVGHLEASPHEAYEAFVPEVPEGFDLLCEVLDDHLGHHRAVPVELLDRHLRAPQEAAEDLPELPGAEVLDELQLAVAYSLLRGQLPPAPLGLVGLRVVVPERNAPRPLRRCWLRRGGQRGGHGHRGQGQRGAAWGWDRAAPVRRGGGRHHHRSRLRGGLDRGLRHGPRAHRAPVVVGCLLRRCRDHDRVYEPPPRHGRSGVGDRGGVGG
mmetsp:Transcript_1607/g.4769  ORF Transcript_1607/g.4769 Transcript_1607/m.4769 type:complete len:364 (+) Transcript_1607:200-1291(+)